MHSLGMALAAFVVFEHVAFMVLEMFFWTKPLGRRIFRRSEEDARSSAGLAANQGLYNGFLAAGLALAFVVSDARWEAFFLACVVAAGSYAALTVSRRIFFVQAVPALVAGALLFLG